MWEIGLSDQVYTFLAAIAFGAAAGLLYDFFYFFRIERNCKSLYVFVLDLLYCLILAFTDFCFFLVRTNGEIRGYVYLAQILGFGLWRFTFSHILRAFLRMLHLLQKWVCTVLYRRIFAPVAEFFAGIFKITKKITKKSADFFKKGLKNDV